MTEHTPPPRTAEMFESGEPSGDLSTLAVRGGTVTLAAQAGLFVVGMTSTIVLARLLTPAEHGLFEMVLPVIGFMTLFRDLGLSHATIQRKDITHEQITNLFWVNIAVSFVLMAATAACAPLVAAFYGEPRLTAVTQVIAAGFLFGGITVQQSALLRRAMKFHVIAAIDVSAAVFGLIAGIVTAYMGLSYWALVIRMLSIVIATEIAVWIASGWRPGWFRRGVGSFSMLVFGAHITMSNLLNYASMHSASLLIGRYCGASPLAFYGKARMLLLQPVQQINMPLSTVVIASLSRLHDQPARYRDFYLRLTGKIALASMPLVAFLMATADWVVEITLGGQWLHAAPIFFNLGAAALVIPVMNTSGWLLISQGRTRLIFRWGFVDAALTVASIAAGLPWGAAGVAAGYSIGTVCVRMPILSWLTGREGPVGTGDYCRIMIAPLVASACVAAAVTGFRHAVAPSPVKGLAAAILIAGVVAAAVYLLIPSSRRELADFGAIIRILDPRNRAPKK